MNICRAATLILLLAAVCLAQEHKEYSAKEQARQVIAAREQQAFEQEFAARERSLAEAEKRHDWPFIAKLLTDDFVEIAADGKRYSKSEVAAYFPDIQLHDYQQDEVRVQRVAADAVLVTSTVKVDASFRGTRIPSHSYVSTLWVRRKGQWKIVFHQVTPIPEPAPAAPQ
ncbi:MAG TPA: nuclear transport factor 2 family protein [Terriglobales bacterium]|nr:nuclear transport factor 2 family protein [Terriglobales bacterium]